MAASDAGGETYEVSAENALALVPESVMIIHNNKSQKDTREAQVTKDGDKDSDDNEEATIQYAAVCLMSVKEPET